MKILLAEDNVVNQKLMLRILEGDGHQVHLAENGKVAVELFKRHDDFNVILMDINMPVMSGIEATKQIIEYDNNVLMIPIIAVTANVCAETEKECYQVGMNGFLMKPFSKELLFKTLGKIVFGADI
jgi:CheY-like chemotaxis protein